MVFAKAIRIYSVMSSIIVHHKQLLYTVPSPVCFKISGSSSFLEQFFIACV
ncbi:MAG: hypothetical protein SPE49_03195 [Campylobacter sp.]|uniref:hypothetical protein n=1 Tax=Campylobacter sp. TaxID=205 RepID=UPI002A80EAF7|nr:hypothetical protein [Campylobacter sp.]MDY5114960.1 hypothetical protein [Campylobacter sp.]